MELQSIRNHRGFFSDYWLGTALSGRGAAGPKLTAAQARKALDRVSRLVDSVNGATAPDLTHFRERFARPLLQDFLGFELRENPRDLRVRPLVASNGGGNGTPASMVLLCPDSPELESRQGRRQLEDALLASNLDYGFLLSPEVLRLVRKPGIGTRGASFDLALAAAVEQDDVDSLSVAYRVLSAQNFVQSAEGTRPIDALESESRRHSSKVSNDLKSAVFEAAERIVAGFLDDVRERSDAFSSPPALAQLRDAGFLALYRLLFILYAEARDERLIQHQLYQRSYSLDQMVARLLRAPSDSLAANRHGLWLHLQAVFRIFNEGISLNLPNLENIPPRGGRLFSDETPEGRMLRTLRLTDRDAASIVLSLATTRPRRGVGRERVSFRELEIEQLGHVYEGLLEYEPAEAKELMIEVKVGGRELALTPDEVVRLCAQKQLHLRGEAALVEGTAAEHLHPELAAEEEGTDEELEDEYADESDESADEAEDQEPAIARGAALTLMRRIEPGTFFFKPGFARKSSGSYYTPTAMVDDLARHALGPLAEGRSAEEIERLRVIDLACGSGHFLVGAARFLGPKLFEAYRREHAGNPPPEFYAGRASSAEVKVRWETEGQDWCRRRIVERCLFGVDLNPAAVQLAQVSLWIESLAGDRPLSFFSHHIRCGNSLLGSSLERFDSPPDPQLGKPSNRFTRGLFETELRRKLDEALAERKLIDAPLPPEVRRDTPEEYAYKEDRLRRADAAIQQAKLLLDLRSAAPFLPEIWRDFPVLVSEAQPEAVARRRPWWPRFEEVRNHERFFHWELEFPEVFLDREHPGFDAVLGNPPWDKVIPSKIEFYGKFDALIRAYKGNELDRRIRELHAKNPELSKQFAAYREHATTLARTLRGGGDFPLAEARSQAAHEDVAKYFVDRAVTLVATGGAVGLVVPSVFYNGDGWVGIRRYLLEEATVERFYGFENRQKIFPIHSSYKFVNLVARKSGTDAGAFRAAFMRHHVEELADDGVKPWEVRVTREEIVTLSTETLAFLEYRGPRDQEIVRKMAAGKPRLGDAEGAGTWGAKFFTDLAHHVIYNATRDRDLWTDPGTGQLYTATSVIGDHNDDFGTILASMRAKGFWPVFEGKHVDLAVVGTQPVRWWLSVEAAEKKYSNRLDRIRAVVYRQTASNTNERTWIGAALPEQSAAANTLTGIILKRVDPEAAATVLGSLTFDFALRLRVSSHVSLTNLRPMPVPAADITNGLPRIPTQLGWETGIKHFTEQESLWPLIWEANKAVAVAYGLNAADLRHILAAFPGMARKRQEFMEFMRSELARWEGS